MYLLRNTILICLVLTPFLVFATEGDLLAIKETTHKYTIAGFKQYASVQVTERWGNEHVNAFIRIIHKESSWTVNGEHYPDGKSSAFGFGGFLDATWETVGCEKTTDQFKQIDCTIEYIAQRYDNPNKALIFHDSKGWY
jgi:hypothetical protein